MESRQVKKLVENEKNKIPTKKEIFTEEYIKELKKIGIKIKM